MATSTTAVMIMLVAVALRTVSVSSAQQQQHNQQSKNHNKQPRIAFGRDARPGEVPWHVSQRELMPSWVTTDQCAGVILSDRWILTAGHCALVFRERYRNDPWALIPPHYLVYGTHRQDFTPVGRVAEVDAILVYPGFTNPDDDASSDIDLALYHTSEPLVLDGVNASAIPIEFEDPPGGTVLQVAGFGRSNTFNLFLQVAEVTVLDRAECTVRFYYKVPMDRMVCTAVFDGRGTPCPGDSGAGLVKLGDKDRNGRAKATLVGVHTMRSGPTCLTDGTASAYVLVAPHIQWLRQVGVPV